jgi:4-carboxymuconolactone decarboxylase
MSSSITGNPDLVERGLRIRREVIGAKYVDSKLAEASSDPFSEPLQQLITEVTWGTIWTREALDHRTRSLLNLAAMTALNRPRQLRLHIRAALHNDVSKTEIAEVLLQMAIYCGVPAALDAFDLAKDVFAELEAELTNDPS